MTNADADLNLLVGLLAAQDDPRSREALVAAVKDWARARPSSLGEFLGARGLLGDPEDRTRASVAALATVAAIPGDDERGTLDDPRPSLAALPAGPDTLGDRFATRVDGGAGDSSADPPGVTGRVAWRPGAGRRFHRVRLHAKGGLGAVFVAHDEELRREVALKEIQERHADEPGSRARFLLEAEITGGLEHPGIVPVYSLGCYPDGRPFYAMRFVRGESLNEAIERFHAADGPDRDPGERALALRGLLGRFVDACNAVGYAHSKGVLHRDIKPANIMLGPHGETLVVDWGLAKALGRPDLLGEGEEGPLRPSSGPDGLGTVAGLAVGTPQYMSPEQAAGRLDRLGPAGDLYSLGATLYALLTGKPPFDQPNTATVLAAVQRGDFPPPRQRDRSIPAGLEAICLKAMALRPEDRYGTAEALADDVEHWLADEPVSALPERWPGRLARWTRRHRSATLAAGAALVLIAAAAVLAAVLIDEARGRAGRALAAERRALDSERRARESAQAQTALAMDAIREYYTGVGRDVLLSQPEMKALRATLLRAPLDFYGRLRSNLEASGQDDPDTLARLAEADYNLGRLAIDARSNEAAIAPLRQAEALQRRLVALRPADPEFAFRLATTLTLLGGRYAQTGRMEDGKAAHAEAMAICERYARDRPDQPRFENLLAENLQLMADWSWDIGELDRARAYYERAVAIGLRLVRDHPSVIEYADKLAASQNNVHILYAMIGRTREAEASLLASTAIRERQVRRDPGDDEARSNLSSCYQNLGSFYHNTGRLGPAADCFAKALAIQEPLARAQPNVAVYQERLATTLRNMASLHIQARRFDRAEAPARRSVAAWERLVDGHPAMALYARGLADADDLLAQVLVRDGRLDEAGRILVRAERLMERVVREDPALHEASDQWARLVARRGALARESGRPDEAEAHFARAAMRFESLAHEHPSVIGYSLRLAEALRQRGALDERAGREDRAEALYRRALAIAEGLDRDGQESPDVAVLRGEALGDLGRLELGRRGDRAGGLLDRAVGVLEAVLRDKPGHPDATGALAVVLGDRAALRGRSGLHRGALADWDRALALSDGPERAEMALGRACALARAGRVREAVDAARAVERSGPVRGRALIRLAAVDALASAAVPSVAEESARRALERLRQARTDPAYADPAFLVHDLADPDFDPLRSRPEFRDWQRDLAFPALPFAQEPAAGEGDGITPSSRR
jgi:eukaryotic-like serine/threonine-protein kinase